MKLRIFSKFKKLFFLIALLILLSSLFYVGTTNLWFFETDTSTSVVNMGNVDIAIKKNIFSFDDMENPTKSFNFEIDNKSNIPINIRIGYTIYITNDMGEVLPVPIENESFKVSTNNIYFDDSLLDKSSTSVTPITVGEYIKNFIVFNSNDGLLMDISNEVDKISGEVQLDFTGFANQNQYKDCIINIVLIPEAIQATHNAREDFKYLGWN